MVYLIKESRCLRRELGGGPACLADIERRRWSARAARVGAHLARYRHESRRSTRGCGGTAN